MGVLLCDPSSGTELTGEGLQCHRQLGFSLVAATEALTGALERTVAIKTPTQQTMEKSGVFIL